MENKPIYQLRKEDFIPIVGLVKHNKRCLNESNNHLGLFYTEEYASQCFTRDTVLVLYNTVIALGATTGLVSLLFK